MPYKEVVLSYLQQASNRQYLVRNGTCCNSSINKCRPSQNSYNLAYMLEQTPHFKEHCMLLRKLSRTNSNMATLVVALVCLACFNRFVISQEACQSFAGGNIYPQESKQAGDHSLHYSKALSTLSMNSTF